MKRKRHTPEQIVKLLNESEPRLVSGEVKMADICRELGVSVATYSRWRNQYGGMKQNEMLKLKKLESENTRLKKLVADLSLDNQILKEAAEGNW